MKKIIALTRELIRQEPMLSLLVAIGGSLIALLAQGIYMKLLCNITIPYAFLTVICFFIRAAAWGREADLRCASEYRKLRRLEEKYKL